MQWVLFILVVYINEQLLSASMDIVCRVHGGFVQVKDADYISCQTSNCTSTEHFFLFLFIIVLPFTARNICTSLVVKGDQTTTDPYIFQLGPII